MIDIEILTAMLKELGYLDDSEEGEGDKREEHAKQEPTTKPERKEHDTKED